MTFEEIFEEEGLYKTDSFRKGVCFDIEKNDAGMMELYLKTYKDENDLIPLRENVVVYCELFKKNYKKVYTRQSLFL